jgi:hypothetical protein
LVQTRFAGMCKLRSQGGGEDLVLDLRRLLANIEVMCSQPVAPGRIIQLR